MATNVRGRVDSTRSGVARDASTTLAIVGAKIIFNLAGLFKDVKTLMDMIKELRHEIYNSTERVVEALAHHAHTGMDTDGGVIFTRSINSQVGIPLLEETGARPQSSRRRCGAVHGGVEQRRVNTYTGHKAEVLGQFVSQRAGHGRSRCATFEVPNRSPPGIWTEVGSGRPALERRGSQVSRRLTRSAILRPCREGVPGRPSP